MLYWILSHAEGGAVVQEQNQFTQGLPQHHKATLTVTVSAMLHPGYRQQSASWSKKHAKCGLFFWFILIHSSYLPGHELMQAASRIHLGLVETDSKISEPGAGYKVFTVGATCACSSLRLERKGEHCSRRFSAASFQVIRTGPSSSGQLLPARWRVAREDPSGNRLSST